MPCIGRLNIFAREKKKKGERRAAGPAGLAGADRGSAERPGRVASASPAKKNGLARKANNQMALVAGTAARLAEEGLFYNYIYRWLCTNRT